MKEVILQKLYTKIIASGIAAMIIFLISLQMSGTWSSLWIGILIAAGFVASFLTIRNNVKKGNVVAIYAQCYEISGKQKTLNPKQRSWRTYRLLTHSLTPDGLLKEDESPTSLYIKAEPGKFREGEGYCLLFSKRENNLYDERNLIAFDKIIPDIITFATDDEMGAPTSNTSREDNPSPDNLIYFKKKDEE